MPDESLSLPSLGCECALLGQFLSGPDKSPPCRLQYVSVPRSVDFFHVLTSPSLCRLQDVSAPPSDGFLPYPDKSLPWHSSGCERTVISSALLICPPFLCSQQVSFLLYIPFFNVFMFCLGISAHIQQADIVLLRCAVIIFMFHLTFTHGRLASSLYI